MPVAHESPTVFSIKNTLARTLRARLDEDRISVSAFAKRIGTGRTAVRRILDEGNTSITLHTMAKAAHALGLRLVLEAKPLSSRELGRLANELVSTKDEAKASRLKGQIIAGFYANPKTNAKSSARKRSSAAS